VCVCVSVCVCMWKVCVRVHVCINIYNPSEVTMLFLRLMSTDECIYMFAHV